jgi:heme/copper-type cytochrome/quinol oxidase subunit 1
MFALLSGLAGTAASVIIRLELSAPGNGILGGNHQLYNSIVTSHALLMIFFMVMFYKNLSYIRRSIVQYISNTSTNSVSRNNNNPKHKYSRRPL